MRIRLSELPAIPLGNVPINVRRVISRDQSDKVSVTWMQIDGAHHRTSMGDRDVVYGILSGTGWFQIADDPRVEVETGDFVFVATGREFEYGGTMEYLTIQSPPFPSPKDAAAA